MTTTNGLNAPIPFQPVKGGLGITTIPSNGQIPIGNGTNYTVAAIIPGTLIKVVNAAGSITLNGQLSQGYIRNLGISFTSTTSITLAAGIARDSTNTYDILLTTTPTINFSTTGVNGLDTGTIAFSFWYAIFVISDSTGVNATAGLASLSQTSPTLPSGYDNFRRIGWVRTQPFSAVIINFIQQGKNGDREYFYVDSKFFVNPLTNGTSITFAAVSLATCVPPTSTICVLNITFNPASAPDDFYFRPTGNATIIANDINGFSRAQGVANGYRINSRMITDSSQSIDYAVTQVTDTITLLVYSYTDSL